ncbi:MAG TPA: tetratricopeptide repeat protein [Thermoanaerobaculia bacterium]|nr:tetratricopeptide repeat protein [Thermoanaerobaculia bacterium]
MRQAWREYMAVERLDPPAKIDLHREGPEFEAAFPKAVVVFDDGDYRAARDQFLPLLRTRTPAMRRLVQDYVTATFDRAGQPELGLGYLCKTYHDRPLADVSARLDFHIFLRSIATKKGFGYVEDLVTRLRPGCPRRDLSYVWAGIPRGKAEQLAAGVTLYDDGRRLGREDAKYLRHVIQRYPSDAFLDHALYFLQEFDTVLREYPNTFLAEVLFRAAGERALKAKDYSGAIKYFTTAAERWPQSAHWDETCEHLADAYRRNGAPETAFEWLSRRRGGGGGVVAAFLGHNEEFTSAREVRSFLRRVRGQKGTVQMRALFESDCRKWFDIDRESLRSGEYEHALAEYEGVAEAFRQYEMAVPSCMQRAIGVLRRVINSAHETPAGLLDLGFYLRDRAADDLGNSAFAAVAADVWEECADRFPGTAEAEKALYLAAAVHRRASDYDQAAALFRRLVKEYPHSELRDDALTEIGWYNYYYQGDTELARKYFRRVLKEYPRRNAADNALNWLARTYCHSGEYDKALETYRRLLHDYGSGRLAILYVRDEYRALRPVVATKARRNTIAGLLEIDVASDPAGAYLSSIKAGSDAERAGLEEEDVVFAVNGETVDGVEPFYELLAAVKPGAPVVLGVIRGVDSKLEIQATVSAETYYAKEPESDCGPLEPIY